MDALVAIRMAGLPNPVRQHPLVLLTGELVHLDIAWPDVASPSNRVIRGGTEANMGMAPTMNVTARAARWAGTSSMRSVDARRSARRRAAPPPVEAERRHFPL